MTIKLFEDGDKRSLSVVFQNKQSSFSVEVEPKVIYHYDDSFNLVELEIHNATLIDPILKELSEILKDPEIKIIRKVA
jgi:hypothetical protein